ncbi:MAG TPA: sirohydrochlorin cobaltochelatase [Anaerovoracaceae bacterium]|nr:sirohydrochlorin cobaltochelatase [Anaerovoracaceae bacterium]
MMKEKRAILAASFGTSHAETLQKTIGAIERDIAAAYPDCEIRRAFTSGMILKVLEKRDGIVIDNVAEAMNRLVSDGFDEVLVQPTHVIPGDEYDGMKVDAEMFADRFDRLIIGKPLLSHTEDYRRVIRAVMEQFPDLNDRDALVLMGHGTEHSINAVYAALDYQFKEMGYPNVFIGTVEGYPDIETVLRQVEAFRPEKVVMMPLMVVAGDHAVNDMAGDEEDSWKSIFERAGYKVNCVLKGLGEFQSIRDIYLEHIADAL